MFSLLSKNKDIKKIRRYIFKIGIAFFFLLLDGCGTHHKTPSNFPVVSVKNLKPHYVSIAKGRMEYYRFGHGSPIILIPGYATDVSSWNQDFLLVLADKHQVILINNRNVGGSTIKSPRYETKELSQDTYQLIKKMGFKKINILGISMGGMIAQQLAVDHPEKLNSLILINTMIAGKKAVLPNDQVKKKLREMPQNKIGLYFTAIQLFFPSSQRIQMAYSLAMNRFQPEGYKEINSQKILPSQQHLILQWSHDDIAANKLNDLSVPTLILNGSADDVIPPINSEILAQTIPNAQIEHWSEGGHAMIYQYPESIAKSINDFVSE